MESLYDLLMNNEDGRLISGYALLQNWGTQPTKTGGKYVAGKLSTAQGIIDFKAWGNSTAFPRFTEVDMVSRVVSVEGKVNVYEGRKSLILNEIVPMTDENLQARGVNAYDFMYSKYNIEAYFSKLSAMMNKNLSEPAFEVYEQIMNRYGEDFKNEFAAVHYHDATRGGLLAHTLKVCQIASIISLYPQISERVSKDLLYLGCALHDLGKVMEYNKGGITSSGKKMCHTILTTYVLSTEFKDMIVAKMGEDFFFDLLAVVSCHHGEMGERPRTVAAYVIHKIDQIESVLCGLDEQIEATEDGEQLKYDDFKLC